MITCAAGFDKNRATRIHNTQIRSDCPAPNLDQVYYVNITGIVMVILYDIRTYLYNIKMYDICIYHYHVKLRPKGSIAEIKTAYLFTIDE